VLSLITSELQWSLKWTLILIVPVAIAVALLAMLFGGIEGGAKVIFLIALAPMFVLEPATKGVEGPVGWGIFVAAESVYLFLIVLIARILWRRLA